MRSRWHTGQRPPRGFVLGTSSRDRLVRTMVLLGAVIAAGALGLAAQNDILAWVGKGMCLLALTLLLLQVFAAAFPSTS